MMTCKQCGGELTVIGYRTFSGQYTVEDDGTLILQDVDVVRFKFAEVNCAHCGDVSEDYAFYYPSGQGPTPLLVKVADDGDKN